jgi:SAM-dependent methyltransferase
MDRREWNRRYEGTDLLWSAEPNRFLVAEVEGLPAGRALDLACGEGRNAVWLAREGWRVTAVDFADVAIAKGRRLAEHHEVADRIEWVEADVTTYELAGPFDLVVVLYLHLPAPQRAGVLAGAVGSLAPGGTFLFVGHDRSNLAGGYGGPQDPDILTVPAEIVAELGDLEIERAAVVERPVETDEGLRVALDTLVRAVRA